MFILVVFVLFQLEDKSTLVIENLTSRRIASYDIELNQSMEIRYIHSLYGGLQVEVFKLMPQKTFRLAMMKFENYDALMYYFSGAVKDEYYEEPFWIMTCEYRTKKMLFILPLIKENFCNYAIKLGNRVVKADEIGSPGDAISIYFR